MTSRVLKCWRFSLIIFTIFYCASGIALLTGVSYVLIRRHSLGYFFGKTRTAIFYLYAPAIFVFLTTVVGWKAIQKKHAGLLKFFSVLITATIFLEIAGAIWCLISRDVLSQSTVDIFQNKFNELRQDASNQHYWDFIQSELKCCGVHGPSDYRQISNTVPFSCCGSSSDHFQASCSFIYQKGCMDVFTTTVAKDFLQLSLVTLILAIVQLSGVFGSWCMSNRVLREAVHA